MLHFRPFSGSTTYVQTVGRDGVAALDAVYAADAPQWLREVPAVQTLRQVWAQQYDTTAEHIRWRTLEEGIPPARVFLSSPYDAQAQVLSALAPVGYSGSGK